MLKRHFALALAVVSLLAPLAASLVAQEKINADAARPD